MTRWMLAFEQRDSDVLWMCKAVPRKWFKSEVGASNVSTLWGMVSFNITPDEEDENRFVAQVSFADGEMTVANVQEIE